MITRITIGRKISQRYRYERRTNNNFDWGRYRRKAINRQSKGTQIWTCRYRNIAWPILIGKTNSCSNNKKDTALMIVSMFVQDASITDFWKSVGHR